MPERVTFRLFQTVKASIFEVIVSAFSTIVSQLKPEEAALVKGFCEAIGAKIGVTTWTSGKKWISEYFKDHSSAVIEKANSNSTNYLDKLASKVTFLEEDNQITKDIIQNTFDSPSFAALLQQSMIGAAKTDNQEKHDFLATLISKRIGETPESIFSLSSPLACEAILSSTSNQIKLLAFLTSTQITPNIPAQYRSANDFLEACEKWMNHRYAPFVDLSFSHLDLMHLEALSCLKVVPYSGASFREVLIHKWRRQDYLLNEHDLFRFKVGPSIRKHWEEEQLKSTTLTSVGNLIGILSSDQLCGADKTTLAGYG